MQAIEIITIILAVLIVGSVFSVRILNKKSGKCSCGCDDCPHFGSCSAVDSERTRKSKKTVKDGENSKTDDSMKY